MTSERNKYIISIFPILLTVFHRQVTGKGVGEIGSGGSYYGSSRSIFIITKWTTIGCEQPTANNNNFQMRCTAATTIKKSDKKRRKIKQCVINVTDTVSVSVTVTLSVSVSVTLSVSVFVSVESADSFALSGVKQLCRCFACFVSKAQSSRVKL